MHSRIYNIVRHDWRHSMFIKNENSAKKLSVNGYITRVHSFKIYYNIIILNWNITGNSRQIVAIRTKYSCSTDYLYVNGNEGQWRFLVCTEDNVVLIAAWAVISDRMCVRRPMRSTIGWHKTSTIYHEDHKMHLFLFQSSFASTEHQFVFNLVLSWKLYITVNK